MALTEQDIIALRALIREEVHAGLVKSGNDPQVALTRKELGDFRHESSGLAATLHHEVGLLRKDVAEIRKDQSAIRAETLANFDALFKRDETREQEGLSIRHQLEELEKKVA